MVRKKRKTHRKMFHWASCEVLSDHGDTIEDDVVDDESSEVSTGTIPPLPPVSWFKETRARRNALRDVVWPNVDLKPSKGSVKGQRYVGPGGEKIDNLGTWTVQVRIDQHGGLTSNQATFQGFKVRKHLLAGSGVIDKGNTVVFDGDRSLRLPGPCTGVASVTKVVTGVQGRIPLHAQNGVFVLRTSEPEETSSLDFSRRGTL